MTQKESKRHAVPLSPSEVRRHAARAAHSKAQDRVEVEKGADGQWYVRIVCSGNNEVVFSAEGSKKKSDALERACRRAMAYRLPVFVITNEKVTVQP